jgi:phage portal protein BeeE
MSNFISNFINLINLKRDGLKNPFNISQSLLTNFNYYDNKPNWVSLATPSDFEKAVRFNPVLKSAINLLATSASNGRKVAVDSKTGEIIEWSEGNAAVKKCFELLVQRPNPLQSAKEFHYQGVFYLKTFGNRYVLANSGTGFNDKEIDILNINSLINLPSQYVEVKTTGKVFRQTDISGIVSEYALNNTSPIEKYNPNEILHFNEVNISSDLPTIMGVSKLEALKQPITNTQKAFEAMNTLLTSRGQQGIISPAKRDGMATVQPTTQEKEEYNKTFKNNYGLAKGQNPYLLSPFPLDYIKTVMSSKEIGIYEEFSHNSLLIGNELGIPSELMKTGDRDITYENQVQSVRRLYQDTTIPMVADEDLYWSWRLNTFKYGFEIKTMWDHIHALQEAFREKAVALNMKGRTAKDAYDLNIITWNQYLEMIDQPTVEGGDVYKNQRNIENEEI